MEPMVGSTAETISNSSSVLDGLTALNANQTRNQSEIPAHPVFIFAYSLVFLVSLLLNSITMNVYFCSNRRMISSVTIYMKNLAAADFLLCLSLPLRIANYASRSQIMSNIYCSFGTTAFYINMYASILFMDFIAANRYLKIVRPLETHTLQKLHTARNICVVTWLSLVATSSIYLILFIQTSWGIKHQSEKIGCEAFHSSQLSLVYKITHCVSMLLFLFVLVSLIALYRGTLKKIQQAQLSMLTDSSKAKFKKSKRNMLVLMGVFCVCFLPYHMVRLPYAFIRVEAQSSASQVFYILKELSVLLSVLNACLDPFIYFIFCKAFRSQMSLRKKKDSEKNSEDRSQQRRSSNLLSYIETKITTLRRGSVL